MAHGAQFVAASVTPGAPAMPAAVPGAPAMPAPIAAAPVTPAPSFVDSSTHVAASFISVAPPMPAAVPGSQAMAGPIIPGPPVATIPVNLDPASTNQSGAEAPAKKPLTKITIDINDKQDTDHVKYRTEAVDEMEIWYAIDGYIISEIQVRGNRRWPKENEVKECKKVLFFKKPEDKKPTLKVIYEDEADAYDPDFPPAKPSTPPADPSNTMAAPTEGAAAPIQEAEVSTHTSEPVSSPGIINESHITSPAPEVTTQHTHISATPLSNDPTHSFGEPNQLNYQAAGITPVQTAPATPVTQNVEEQVAYSPASVDLTDWTTPSDSDQGVKHVVHEEHASMGSDDSSLLFAAATIDYSTRIPSPQSVQTGPDGKKYVDIKMDSDGEDDDDDNGVHHHHGFQVEEVRGYDPDDDDGYERVPLTQYVTQLGYRVGDLERRMDPVEDQIEMLSRLVDYQHEMLHFSGIVNKKTPFGADFGRHAHFDTDGFRPATSLVSKILDSSEYPSDIELFVADAADATKLAKLDTAKFKVKQEGDEIHYVLESDVNCKLVTFGGKTVWNHREADPHPVGVVFHPDDDKVVVDFDDAIVMYVKKGELTGDSR
ncbi:hypothetical protein MACJ_002642 [Theileria orientalis]|uniref:Uncharacterized protein n=1 Tax=Theileria orientalis TaxID=68886 RepID=A0A976QSH2_THEOR|nr:hypothetical protein MACJ_002642 [Theileria orientalis]